MTENFKRVFLEVPLGGVEEEPVKFNISPQPVFNKNFELLTADIKTKTEQGMYLRRKRSPDRKNK